MLYYDLIKENVIQSRDRSSCSQQGLSSIQPKSTKTDTMESNTFSQDSTSSVGTPRRRSARLCALASSTSGSASPASSDVSVASSVQSGTPQRSRKTRRKSGETSTSQPIHLTDCTVDLEPIPEEDAKQRLSSEKSEISQKKLSPRKVPVEKDEQRVQSIPNARSEVKSVSIASDCVSNQKGADVVTLDEFGDKTSKPDPCGKLESDKTHDNEHSKSPKKRLIEKYADATKIENEQNTCNQDKPKPNKVSKKLQHEQAMSLGRRKSGRFWKAQRDRFKSVVKPKGLKQSSKLRIAQKQELLRVKEFEKALKNEKKQEWEEKRKRQEENKKRREENQRKTEIVQQVFYFSG